MKYRLIRFSTDGSVVLDANVDVPNEKGDNNFWLQHSNGGYAFLYDRAVQRWYKLNERDGTVKHTDWIDHGDKELPKYVEMLKLVGSL